MSSGMQGVEEAASDDGTWETGLCQKDSLSNRRSLRLTFSSILPVFCPQLSAAGIQMHQVTSRPAQQ